MPGIHAPPTIEVKTLTCQHCQHPASIEATACLHCGGSLIGPAARVQSGHLLGTRYRIIRPLARGGMGAVYLAHDLVSDTTVAVKEMRVGGLGQTEALDRAIAAFHREAHLLAQLAHPNLPHVHDQFAHDGTEYLVMEFVPGHTLAAHLHEHAAPFSEKQVRAWGQQICNVFTYLHERNPPLIYRDLKPANVMLRPDGQLVLIDFGIARFYQADQGDTAVFGTVGYAPPEQYQGKTEARSDLWSLGVLLHQLATGYNPLDHPYRPLPPARDLRPDLSPQFELIIQRATAERPGARFAAAATFGAALAGTLKVTALRPAEGAPHTRTRRGRRLFGVIATLALIGVLVASAAGTLSAGLLPALTPSFRPSPAAQATATPAPPPPPVAPKPADMEVVVAGAWFMGDPTSRDPAALARTGAQNSAQFWLDRNETTNAQYAACGAAGACLTPRDPGSLTRTDYYVNALYAGHPVVNVTWQQAQAFCRWRGRRLPTEAEWEKAARGTTDQRAYPWGNDWPEQANQVVDSLVNSWGGSGDTLLRGDTRRVNTRRAGASPYGINDLVGNVGEWTSTLDRSGRYSATDGRESATAAGQRVVRGLPVGDDPLAARLTTRTPADPDQAAPTIGFRCAAGDGVLRQADGTLVGQAVQQAPAGMVLVRGGLARVGTTLSQAEAWTQPPFNWPFAEAETPEMPTTLGDLYMDRHEVTNRDYQDFVVATAHTLPTNSFDPEGLSIWRDASFAPRIATHPIVNVTWNDAQAYCDWRGKRLPTEAEWEWAAKGADNRLWPWGNQRTGDEMNTVETRLGTTAPVDAFGRGDTPDGVANMGGNVTEWTSTLSLPYPYNQLDGREDPHAEGARVLRGGSWLDPFNSAHTSARAELQVDLGNVNVGFRCVQSAE